VAYRNDYPNTNGGWVQAPGYPLVEIMSDGTSINVKARPIGGRALSELSEGERLAYEYQSTAYFFGEASAIANKEKLQAWHSIQAVGTNAGTLTVGKDEIPAWLQKDIDAKNAQYAKDRADAEAALKTGMYATPAPPPPPQNQSHDPPPALPVVTTGTQAQLAILKASQTPAVNKPPLLSPAGASGSSSTSPAMFWLGALLLGALGWFLLRRGKLA
jgi:LPXTG-motif cell wall-anchored protein